MSLTDQNSQQERQIIELKHVSGKAISEKERLMEENSKLHAIMEERERNRGFIEEQMRVLEVNTIL